MEENNKRKKIGIIGHIGHDHLGSTVATTLALRGMDAEIVVINPSPEELPMEKPDPFAPEPLLITTPHIDFPESHQSNNRAARRKRKRGKKKKK